MADANGLLTTMRGDGWRVAVHNDYRLEGRDWTFWLLTHPSGVWAKGEGVSDAIALSRAHDEGVRALAQIVHRLAAQSATIARLREALILLRMDADDAGMVDTVDFITRALDDA